jgi:hypothetical protein
MQLILEVIKGAIKSEEKICNIQPTFALKHLLFWHSLFAKWMHLTEEGVVAV